MPHVITQACCSDGACIPACPVQCIRPRPGDPQFISTEQLYIDPALCIDCGACLDVCPVDAIEVDYYLTEPYRPYLNINAEYFTRHPIEDVTALPEVARSLPEGQALRVAIVGAGPAGCYAAATLLELPNVAVTMLDRLPTPHGLARAGIAPDHQKTRGIGRMFDRILGRPEVRCLFNVEVGRDVTLDELRTAHHAVIWAAGATGDRRIGIPGEDLPGCHSAREFVAWYNGHPDRAAAEFDLAGGHVVIVGNGNVAIDAARMLVGDVEALDRTDMADHAVAALRASGVRDVTIAARRGPSDAAYSLPELLALSQIDGVRLTARTDEIAAPADRDANPLKRAIVEQAARADAAGRRRIALRFHLTPIAIAGDDRVRSITFARNRLVDGRFEPTGETETIETSLVLRAVGYRGEPVPGLPFDDASGTIANRGGRVVDPGTDAPITGMYCAGWSKRGATGVLGTNKRCAAETIDALLADLAADRLEEPHEDDVAAFAALLPHALDFAAWSRIDAAELAAGKARRRARAKFVAIDAMLGAAIAGQ